MKLKALITIVVPIYQVKDYLGRCLDSIRAQTLMAFTCLLIDDGSCDGAGTLCREVIARDARFRLIHQPNAGLSAARNRGLEALSASCDYVTFVLRFPVGRIYEDCALTYRLLYPEPAVALTRAPCAGNSLRTTFASPICATATTTPFRSSPTAPSSANSTPSPLAWLLSRCKKQ